MRDLSRRTKDKLLGIWAGHRFCVAFKRIGQQGFTEQMGISTPLRHCDVARGQAGPGDRMYSHVTVNKQADIMQSHHNHRLMSAD